MSEPTFMSLVRGNRVEGFLGMKMDPGYTYRFATNYAYVELPLARVVVDSQVADVDKILRNQAAVLQAPATLKPSYGHQGLLVFNPLLFRYAMCPSMQIVDTDEKVQIEVPIRTYKDLQLNELDWLVRVYLYS